MAYREFIDTAGVAWRVWSTVPSRGTSLRGGFNEGWLTFERTSGETTELRRLVPVPRDWETRRDEHLEMLCRAATAVRRFSPTGARPEARQASAAEDLAK